MITIDEITLSEGDHDTPADGMCFLEAVAYFGYGPFSDRPACVSPVIAEFGRTSNDKMPDNETRDKWLKPLIPIMIGTAGSAELELRRAFRLADWAVREIAPIALDRAGLGDHAATLRALLPIVDEGTAHQSARVISLCAFANDTAYYAHDAAYDAACYAYDANEAVCAAYGAARAAAYAALTVTGKDVIYAMISDIIKELCAMKDEVGE